MRSIELTFDETMDAAIRSDWNALASAGLPSLASHTADSNRPHLTLAAGEDLHPVPVRGLPLAVRFGGIAVFPASKGRFVLVRSIVASHALLLLHRYVHESLEATALPDTALPGTTQELTLPDRWTPHVTVSRRLDAAQVALALPLLEPLEGGVAVAARLWDSGPRTLTALGESGAG
jgi:2'-5' RNA ligase